MGNLYRTMGQMEDAHSNLESALAIHREVGNLRLEGMCLGELGELHREQGRLEDAHRSLEAALAMHRQVGNRRHEGADLTRLGRLLLNEGQIAQARDTLTSAEVVLREVDDPIELGKWFCARCEVETAAENVPEALNSLREAEAIVARIRVGQHSELGQRIVTLRRALTAS
jgi:tetratricopeptide (TPR) repeat protein